MGPVYCETPSVVSGFPAEIVNTWSNLFIIALGIAAFVVVARRSAPERAGGLYLLATLLTATGIGSFLWHGFRTSSFLILDALPGALFLLSYCYLWLRTFYSRRTSITTFLVFLLLLAYSIDTGAHLLAGNMFFVGAAPPIVLLGAWLIARTYQESRRAAGLAATSLACALIALVFRSIDLSICPSFPLGTHFLWHLFLSLAALLGVYALRAIATARLEHFRANLHMDVHA